MFAAQLNVYGWITLAAIGATALAWSRYAGRDARLTVVYFCGLIGALVGAKLAFLLAEGWHYRGDWLALLSGRSITGALLGGYLAVEIGKKVVGYRAPTGDLFAILVPLSLAFGRLGCVVAGCCPGVECAAAWWALPDASGVPRWPAAAVEGIFNAAFAAWAMVAARFGWQRGNRFHVYMITYGVFRFGHEFARDDTRIVGPFTGYHLIAVALVVVGTVRYVQRAGNVKTSRRPTYGARHPSMAPDTRL